MRVDALSGRDREAALELAQRQKHDLGKYVTLQARWLPADAGPEARREALRVDLLETRRGEDGVQGASTVWAPFEATWSGREALWGEARVDCSDDPDVACLIEDMAGLRRVADAIDGLSSHEVEEALAMAARVTATTQRLVRRLRGGD